MWSRIEVEICRKAPWDIGLFLVYSEKCVYLQSISGGRLVG